MKYQVIGIDKIKKSCIYDENEDALLKKKKILLDFKKNYKNYLMYTKFLINSKRGRNWISFQFIPKDLTFLARKFAIITAYNPKNLILNEFENFLRNVKLEREIKKYEYYLSIGTLFYYSEKSFIIYDIEKSEAIELGNRFNQDSIFYNDTNSISITKCEDKKDIIKFNFKEMKWITKIEK